MYTSYSFQIRIGNLILSHIRCRVVEKVIRNMVLDLVLGVLMMCNEVKDTDRLVDAYVYHLICSLCTGIQIDTQI